MSTRLRAAIYTRISSDPEGLALGVARQEQDCRALAERRGLEVVQVYEENDVSASTRSRKRRPQYEEMMRAAEAGEIDAIVFYTASRLTRRPIEYERIIALVEQRKTQLFSVASGDHDLSTAEGRAMARTVGAWDAAEAERISERVTRAAKQRAENGQFHGSHPAFGYESIKEVQNGRERVTEWRIHPEHSAWVHEAVQRILTGESLYGVTSSWTRAGRTTGQGGTWTPRTLKRILKSPALIGFREYKGSLYKAVWPPILDHETWEQVQAVLDERAAGKPQFDPKGNKRKYILSGLVRCSDCGAVMRSMGANKGAPVGFVHPLVNSADPDHPHHAMRESRRISMDALEAWVIPQFLEYIDSPAVQEALSVPESTDSSQQVEALRNGIAADERRLEHLQDQFVDEELDARAFARQQDRLRNRIEANALALRKIVGSTAVTLPSGKEVRALWDKADNTRKRELISLFIDRVEIGKMPKGMATNLTKRRTESQSEYDKRLAEHSAKVLAQRVRIVWS